MLLDEGGLQQLETVGSHPETHEDVRKMTKSILDSLQMYQARRCTRTGRDSSLDTGQRCLTLAHKEKDAQ
ncbi:hypothetical protein AALO_G00126590 [Alosa alosa]|uniref:Uncharacterized protein n=1 Tax=Alosa alosa TaxID=278164 RepID=A0AAV6GL91_9TELE|nr:hypothetical protein AALO_G00126590 [Alosa alosa]